MKLCTHTSVRSFDSNQRTLRRFNLQLFQILSISSVSLIQLIGFSLCCCSVFQNGNDNSLFFALLYFKWLNQPKCEIVLCVPFFLFFFGWWFWFVFGYGKATLRIDTNIHLRNVSFACMVNQNDSNCFSAYQVLKMLIELLFWTKHTIPSTDEHDETTSITTLSKKKKSSVRVC